MKLRYPILRCVAWRRSEGRTCPVEKVPEREDLTSWLVRSPVSGAQRETSAASAHSPSDFVCARSWWAVSAAGKWWGRLGATAGGRPTSFPRGPICMIFMLSRSHPTGEPGSSPHWAGARADPRQAQGVSLARDWPEFRGPLFCGWRFCGRLFVACRLAQA